MARNYTQEETDYILNAVHREGRPRPWQGLAQDLGMGKGDADKVQRYYWGLVTGYTGPTARCPRRVYKPGPQRVDRTGTKWTAPDRRALVQLHAGKEGQLRVPPVDVPYLAAILGRTVEDVEQYLESKRARPQGLLG